MKSCSAKNCLNYEEKCSFCAKCFSIIPFNLKLVIEKTYKIKSKDVWKDFIDSAIEIIEQKKSHKEDFLTGYKNCKTTQEKRMYWNNNIARYKHPVEKGKRKSGPISYK